MSKPKYTTSLDLVFKPITEESIASVIKNEVRASSFYQELLGENGSELASCWDIIPVRADLAVINQFNKNQEGIDTNTALKYHKRFRNKPLNLEHNKQTIVGHITNTYFSRYSGSFVPVGVEELIGEKEPFYLSFAGVIYSKIFPKVAEEIIISDDPSSITYQDISASWEVGFNNFHIALGSINLSECEIITDTNEIIKLASYLKKNGGSGYTPDNRLVNRLLVDEIYPYGAGLTTNPAANVSGVNVLNLSEDTTVSDDMGEDDYDDYASLNDKNEEIIKNNDNFEKNISQSISNNVIEENTTMNEEQFKALMAKVQESLASVVSPDKVESAVDQFASVLNEHGQVWKSKVEIEEAKAAESAAKLETALAEIATLKEQNEEKSQRLVELETAIANREAAETFNLRMKTIEDTFELSEAEIEIISQEVKDITTDEAFAAYSNKMNILLSTKTKEAIAKCKEDAEKAMAAKKAKEAKAEDCEEEDEKEEEKEESKANVEEVIEKVEESTASVVNTPSTETESLVQRLTKNWKREEQVTISK